MKYNWETMYDKLFYLVYYRFKKNKTKKKNYFYLSALILFLKKLNNFKRLFLLPK